MSSDIVTTQQNLPSVNMASVAVREYFRSGNVAQLSPEEKDFVLSKLCERYGLDPILRPFDLISFQGGQKFYMTASATNQLANAKGLTREVTDLQIDEKLMMAKCSVKVSSPDNRYETANGFIAVSKFLAPTKENPVPRKVMMDGEDLANALLKLETKTKRRATMSFFGVMDAGSDYEDRPAVAVAAPDVSRPAAIADATAARTLVQSAQPAPAPMEVSAPVQATAPVEAPATEKRKPGRPAAAKKVEATEQAPETSAPVEASIPTIAPIVDVEIIPSAPAVAPAPAPAPVQSVTYVKYSRTQHAKELVSAATRLFGDNGWANDEAKKSAVKAAIPELDGRANLFVAGSDAVLPEFDAALKACLVKFGVAKAG